MFGYHRFRMEKEKLYIKLQDLEQAEMSSDAEKISTQVQQPTTNQDVPSEGLRARKKTFKRGGSKLVRRNSFSKVPEGFFSVTRTMSVNFRLPTGEIVTINCAGNRTVGQIKGEVMVSV